MSQETENEVSGVPTEAPRQQTISALVENKAGVLARVVGLFARRGFNITSLAVAPTEDERFSRITFVYDTGSAPVEQVISQVNKLVNVIRIDAIEAATSVVRELLLASFKAATDLSDLLAGFGAVVVDQGRDAVVVQLVGHPDRLDEFCAAAAAYGIDGMQRTGRIALPR